MWIRPSAIKVFDEETFADFWLTTVSGHKKHCRGSARVLRLRIKAMEKDGLDTFIEVEVM